MKKINYNLYPDKNGRFAEFGGKYVSETLMYPLSELEKAYKKIGKSASFKKELTVLTGVEAASSSSGMLTRGNFGDFYTPKPTADEPHIATDISLSSYLVDDAFIPTLDLEIVEGRGFDKQFKDSLSVILNETAAAQIGWENPIGKQIRYPGGNMEYYTVVGILKDFNLESLHTSIEPFALFAEASKSYDTRTTFISLKISGEHTKKVIGQVQDLWESYLESTPFEYSFLDEDLAYAYQEDQRLASLFTGFSILAIFVGISSVIKSFRKIFYISKNKIY